MSDPLIKYRADLVETEKFLKDNYDKLVITLSGGALALSLAFLKDIVNLDKAVSLWLLILSWSCFILSLSAVLGAISFGIEAHRRAIHQVDEGIIHQQIPGGFWSKLTKNFHRSSALLLLTGLICLAIFVFINIGENNGSKTKSKPSATTTEATTATKANPKQRQPCKALLGSSSTTEDG